MSDFVEAAKLGNLQLLLDYIKAGFDVNTPSYDDTTALYWAACENRVDICSLLLQHGADPNRPASPAGSCPLHAAADRGHSKCVYLLIKNGARINAQSTARLDTPLHHAAYRGHYDVCKMLLDYGADVAAMNKEGKTASQEASTQKQHNVHKLLWQKEIENPKARRKRQTVRKSQTEILHHFRPKSYPPPVTITAPLTSTTFRNSMPGTGVANGADIAGKSCDTTSSYFSDCSSRTGNDDSTAVCASSRSSLGYTSQTDTCEIADDIQAPSCHQTRRTGRRNSGFSDDKSKNYVHFEPSSEYSISSHMYPSTRTSHHGEYPTSITSHSTSMPSSNKCTNGYITKIDGQCTHSCDPLNTSDSLNSSMRTADDHSDISSMDKTSMFHFFCKREVQLQRYIEKLQLELCVTQDKCDALKKENEQLLIYYRNFNTLSQEMAKARKETLAMKKTAQHYAKELRDMESIADGYQQKYTGLINVCRKNAPTSQGKMDTHRTPTNNDTQYKETDKSSFDKLHSSYSSTAASMGHESVADCDYQSVDHNGIIFRHWELILTKLSRTPSKEHIVTSLVHLLCEHVSPCFNKLREREVIKVENNEKEMNTVQLIHQTQKLAKRKELILHKLSICMQQDVDKLRPVANRRIRDHDSGNTHDGMIYGFVSIHEPHNRDNGFIMVDSSKTSISENVSARMQIELTETKHHERTDSMCDYVIAYSHPTRLQNVLVDLACKHRWNPTYETAILQIVYQLFVFLSFGTATDDSINVEPFKLSDIFLDCNLRPLIGNVVVHDERCRNRMLHNQDQCICFNQTDKVSTENGALDAATSMTVTSVTNMVRSICIEPWFRGLSEHNRSPAVIPKCVNVLRSMGNTSLERPISPADAKIRTGIHLFGPYHKDQVASIEDCQRWKISQILDLILYRCGAENQYIANMLPNFYHYTRTLTSSVAFNDEALRADFLTTSAEDLWRNYQQLYLFNNN